ncbi:MAG TPA: SGNH/GDSL hydrolase family protein [Salinarimonas sp.]|nr:SGNH/GDSL hydrolase family protein [Salinarimonas sp.]
MAVLSAARRLLGAIGLSIALGMTLLAAPAWAVEPPCAVAKPVFSVRKGLDRLAIELRRQAKIRILAIGSSSTSGVGATAPERAYPAQLQAHLAGLTGRSDVVVENEGIAGEAADATIGRLEAKVAEGRYDLVIWQVGTNDAVRGADEGAFRDYLARGIAVVRRSGADLVLLDQQFFPSVKDPARYERYVAILAETAQAGGVALFSRFALMKAWGERSRETLQGMLAGDGFHMSDRGYGCLAALLADDLLKAVAPGASAPAVAGIR